MTALAKLPPSDAISRAEARLSVDYCDACEGTGHWWRHGNAADGSEYAVETNITCEWCKGSGVIEAPVEQLEMDEREFAQ